MDTSSNEGFTHTNIIPFDSDTAGILLDPPLLFPSMYCIIVGSFCFTVCFSFSPHKQVFWYVCPCHFPSLQTWRQSAKLLCGPWEAAQAPAGTRWPRRLLPIDTSPRPSCQRGSRGEGSPESPRSPSLCSQPSPAPALLKQQQSSFKKAEICAQTLSSSICAAAMQCFAQGHCHNQL